MYLCGDIGGTHTRLALFEESENNKPYATAIFPSRNYPGLEEILIDYLKGEKKTFSKACFGIAGPIREGICHTANLPWTVDVKKLEQRFKIPHVYLINDLLANAYGIRALKPEELYPLQKGSPVAGNKALISAGTGLGEAGFFWDGKQYHPFPCEGGHVDFAPRNAMEIELLVYLKKKFGHVSYERIVSGPGLLSTYEFLLASKNEKIPVQIEAAMKKSDPAAVIAQNIHDSKCKAALHLFISCYGSEAGNLALKFLALGGVYIGGGIAPHILKELESGIFLSAFSDKGRFQELLTSIPIWVILNDLTALFGAAEYVRQK